MGTKGWAQWAEQLDHQVVSPSTTPCGLVFREVRVGSELTGKQEIQRKESNFSSWTSKEAFSRLELSPQPGMIERGLARLSGARQGQATDCQVRRAPHFPARGHGKVQVELCVFRCSWFLFPRHDWEGKVGYIQLGTHQGQKGPGSDPSEWLWGPVTTRAIQRTSETEGPHQKELTRFASSSLSVTRDTEPRPTTRLKGPLWWAERDSTSILGLGTRQRLGGANSSSRAKGRHLDKTGCWPAHRTRAPQLQRSAEHQGMGQRQAYSRDSRPTILGGSQEPTLKPQPGASRGGVPERRKTGHLSQKTRGLPERFFKSSK